MLAWQTVMCCLNIANCCHSRRFRGACRKRVIIACVGGFHARRVRQVPGAVTRPTHVIMGWLDLCWRKANCLLDVHQIEFLVMPLVLIMLCSLMCFSWTVVYFEMLNYERLFLLSSFFEGAWLLCSCLGVLRWCMNQLSPYHSKVLLNNWLLDWLVLQRHLQLVF